jgi:hypothetical protein
MRIKSIIILLFLSLNLYSQTIDYNRIDSLVNLIEVPNNTIISKVPGIITEQFKTQTEKVCAIYCWIAQNIAYDTVGFKNNYWTNYPSDSAIIFDAYRLRKGVCSGYSYLFKYFLGHLNTPTIVVDGYLRVDLETLHPTESNHSWNIAEINKKWFLFDVTAARDDILSKKTDFYWFMSRPEEFIVSHYPNNDKWTLLQKKITLEDFLAFPIISKQFFKLGFSNSYTRNGTIKKFLGEDVRIYIKPTFACLSLPKTYNLENGEKIETKYKNLSDLGCIDFKFPNRGNYALKISVLIQDNSGYRIINDILIYNVIIQ